MLRLTAPLRNALRLIGSAVGFGGSVSPPEMPSGDDHNVTSPPRR